MKLKRKIIAIIVLLIGIIGLFYIFYKEGTLPVDKNNKETKIFIVKPGEGLNQTVKNLAMEGLIRNRVVFFVVAKQLGIEKKIQAGDFRLSPSMSAYQIAKTLTHGTLDTWVTIIEGLRKEEIAQITSRELGIPEIELIKAAREGYLFPDTYLIPKDATAETVITIMDNNFQRRFNEAQASTPKRNNLTNNQILVLASLVEREARFAEDRPQVANILLRRIIEGHKLQVDATVQYVLGYQAAEKRWWKKELTFEDLTIDSPYNTYQNFGLPPAPICNPGLASIKAALQATDRTPYLFYVSDSKGHLHYARNSEEHQANINKYLR